MTPPRTSRIESIFADLRESGRRAIMPFITGGHPTLATTAAVLPALQSAGASIVEVGIPFSDPIADGPVIAAAMHEVLESGVTLDDVFATVARVRPTVDLGIVAMVSHSIVHRTGAEAFTASAAAAGFDGLIVPDLDLDTADGLRALTDAAGLTLSPLVAPTTEGPRLERIVGLATGFVYVLARAGITGESTDLPDVAGRVEALRAMTDLPLAVGFGISTAEHVRHVTRSADAAIVGSALVRRMSGPGDAVAEAGAFIGDLARGLA
ncbi:MAG: tryptophan synthase subunit alpha [Planctomycetota bacterium]|jgi:tryptophan synthase alpha chain